MYIWINHPIYIISPLIYFIEHQSIYQSNSINIIITKLGVMSRWSHIKINYQYFRLIFFKKHYIIIF